MAWWRRRFMLPVSAQPLGRGAGVVEQHGWRPQRGSGACAGCLDALVPCTAGCSAGSFVPEDKAWQGPSCAGRDHRDAV